MTRNRYALVLAVVLAGLSTTARAQLVVPPLKKHGVDVGYAMRWFHRDVTAPPLSEVSWDVASFYARLGVFDWLTVCAEAGMWSIEHDDFPGQVFDRYVIGGGLAANVFRFDDWTLIATASYCEVWDNDESVYSFDKRVYRTIVAVPLSRFVLRGSVGLEMWAAPFYVNDVVENVYYGADVFRDEPDQHWGALAGTQVVFWHHAAVLLTVQYVDYVEGLVGIAFTTGGDD